MLRHLGAAVLGMAVALAAVDVHRIGPSGLPWGLVLAAAASAATAWWLRGSRAPRTAASYGAGWLVLFTVVVIGRPEGDYVLAADLRGYAMMVLALVVVVISVSSLTLRSPVSEPPRT